MTPATATVTISPGQLWADDKAYQSGGMRNEGLHLWRVVAKAASGLVMLRNLEGQYRRCHTSEMAGWQMRERQPISPRRVSDLRPYNH